jgi:hypothetical protein
MRSFIFVKITWDILEGSRQWIMQKLCWGCLLLFCTLCRCVNFLAGTQIEMYLAVISHPVYWRMHAKYMWPPLQLPKPVDYQARTILYERATTSNSTVGRWRVYRDTLSCRIAGTSRARNGVEQWQELSSRGCTNQQPKMLLTYMVSWWDTMHIVYIWHPTSCQQGCHTGCPEAIGIVL